jgi:hypothetical protein
MAVKPPTKNGKPPTMPAMAGVAPTDLRAIPAYLAALAAWLDAELAKQPEQAREAGQYLSQYARDSSNQWGVLLDWYAEHEV